MALPRYLRERECEPGEWSVLAPSAVSEDNLSGPGAGSLGRSAPEALECLTTGLEEWLWKGADERGVRALIMEDALARATDPVIVRDPEAAVCAGRAYHQASTRRPEDVGRVLGLSGAYPSVGVLATQLDETLFHSPISWTPDQLGQIVERATAVILGAWDGDGFAVWRGPASGV